MTDTPSKTTTRRPDCVTEIRMGNRRRQNGESPGGRKPLPDQPRPVTSCR